MTDKKLIFYSDLDGTILDFQNYSFAKSTDALKKIKENNIPLVMSTAKTKAEIDPTRKKLFTSGLINDHPFIIEGGSAAYIAKGYFDFDIKEIVKNYPIDEEKNYYIIQISKAKYGILVKILKDIGKQINAKIIGFSDFSAKELSKDSGLTIEQAELSKNRKFDEPFRIEPDDPKLYNKVAQLIRKKGLNYTRGGRYAHIADNHDKGLTVKILNKLYKRQFGQIKSIGIGDSENDFEFLEICDEGYLVKNPKLKMKFDLKSEKIIKINQIGPVGFAHVIAKTTRGYQN